MVFFRVEKALLWPIGQRFFMGSSRVESELRINGISLGETNSGVGRISKDLRVEDRYAEAFGQ